MSIYFIYEENLYLFISFHITTPSYTKVYDNTPLNVPGSVSNITLVETNIPNFDIENISLTDITYTTITQPTSCPNEADLTNMKVMYGSQDITNITSYTYTHDYGTLQILPVTIDPDDPDPMP